MSDEERAARLGQFVVETKRVARGSALDQMVEITDIHVIQIEGGGSLVAWKEGGAQRFEIFDSPTEAELFRAKLEVVDVAQGNEPTEREIRKAHRALDELELAMLSDAELSRIDAYEEGRLAQKRPYLREAEPRKFGMVYRHPVTVRRHKRRSK